MNCFPTDSLLINIADDKCSLKFGTERVKRGNNVCDLLFAFEKSVNGSTLKGKNCLPLRANSFLFQESTLKGKNLLPTPFQKVTKIILKEVLPPGPGRPAPPHTHLIQKCINSR